MNEYYGDPGIESQPPILVLSSPERIKQQYLNLIRSASSEILLIFPTINAIHREYKIGVMEELRNAIERGVKIRILSAEDDFIKDKLDALRASGIVIRKIESPTDAKFKMLIADKKFAFTVETRDDSKASFSDAVGHAILSSSKDTVLPYSSIFESFWRETDLYERAREADRVKDEFVNIAAHELRSPIMPILSGADAIKEKIALYKDKLDGLVYDELFSESQLIVRNASKLFKLSEDILQVSRIESGTFALHIEKIDLVSLLNSVIIDVEKRYVGERPDVKIICQANPNWGLGLFTIYCDADKLGQTFYNLLDNAMKFTDKGTISVLVNMSDKEVAVQIRDSGPGIDPDVQRRLFEKFVSKSEGGTGLGLYLSKKIIDAHSGRIWVSENKIGHGTTFSVGIPLDLSPESNDSDKSPENISQTRTKAVLE